MSAPLASTSKTPSSTAGHARGRFRWVICALLLLSVTLNYVDRQILGILKQPLSEDLGWSDADYATIVAWFQYAYAFGYLFGGRMMDRLGARHGLAVAVCAWSIACACHGFARSVTGFIFARVGLGLAEGGNFPGSIKTVAEWFPVKERALATGIFNSGTNIGAIACPLLVPWAATVWGWQSTFIVTGALGVVWIVAWLALYDSLENHRLVSEAERDYIRSGQPAVVEKPVAAPWLSLLRHRAVWAYLIAGILAGPVWPFYLFFLPDFLQKRFDLSLIQVGRWIAVFYLLASFGGIAGGWLSAWLMDRGFGVNATRKLALLACAVCALPVFLAPSLPTVWMTVGVIGLGGAAYMGWAANLFSFVSDTMPRHAVSSIIGLGGFVSYFTGGLVANLAGHLLETTGSYESLFMGASLMCGVSLITLHLLVPRIKADQDPSRRNT